MGKALKKITDFLKEADGTLDHEVFAGVFADKIEADPSGIRPIYDVYQAHVEAGACDEMCEDCEAYSQTLANWGERELTKESHEEWAAANPEKHAAALAAGAAIDAARKKVTG